MEKKTRPGSSLYRSPGISYARCVKRMRTATLRVGRTSRRWRGESEQCVIMMKALKEPLYENALSYRR